MAQIRIYGRRNRIGELRSDLSDTIHACAVEALGLPEGKRFHRFIALDAEDFIYRVDRGERYTIIEISMFEGRTVETKKWLIRLLFERLASDCGPRQRLRAVGIGGAASRLPGRGGATGPRHRRA